jgi:hypothetical protein
MQDVFFLFSFYTLDADNIHMIWRMKELIRMQRDQDLMTDREKPEPLVR